MSNTHDFDIENANGANFRANLNNALDDIQSTNSGTSEPTTKVAGKLWIDTTNNLIKIRNTANNGWVTLGSSNTANMGFATLASPAFTGTVTSGGDIVCNSTGRLKLPVGTTAQRPGSPATGDSRWNTTLSQQEVYNGTSWERVGGVPAGSIFWFGSTTVPTGYLECNGAAVSRTTYAQLFSAIGTTHGSGNGSSTFNVPNCRGEFIRGWDNGRGVDSGRGLGSSQGDSTARPNSNFTTNEPGTHRHNYTDDDHQGNASSLASWGVSRSSSMGGGGSTGAGTQHGWISGASGNHSHSITGGGDSETRGRNIALMAVIKY